MDFEFTDERGWLRQLTHDTWKQVNVSQTKAGVFRGKHYHAHNREAFYIISGEIEIFLEKDGEQRHLTVKNNDFFAIEPGTVHTFTFNQDTLMVIRYRMLFNNVASATEKRKTKESFLCRSF